MKRIACNSARDTKSEPVSTQTQDTKVRLGDSVAPWPAKPKSRLGDSVMPWVQTRKTRA